MVWGTSVPLSESWMKSGPAVAPMHMVLSCATSSSYARSRPVQSSKATSHAVLAWWFAKERCAVLMCML